jgi:LysM repeat protein
MKNIGNKMMRNTSLAFILLISFNLSGQKLSSSMNFIIGSEATQKMEFAYSNTKAGKEYVKYLFKVSNDETIIFDIAVESDAEIHLEKPKNAIVCNPSTWNNLDAATKESIISGNQSVHLVLPIGLNQYRITPVYAVEWIKTVGNKCEFRSNDMEFILDIDREIILSTSNNLIQKLSEEKVGQCKIFMLRKNSKIQSSLYKDVTWTSKLGVIKETFSENQGEYALLRIQGISVTEYMNKQCEQHLAINQKEDTQDFLRTKGSEEKSYNGKTHVVEQGETFFGIAKIYQILPGELIDFNPTIDPNKMNIGLIINIPPVKKPSVIPEGMYVMQEGDSKEKISQLFGVTHLDINNWNPDFDKKVVGDLIFVKSPSKGTDLEGVRTKGANVTVDKKPKNIVKTQWWETTDGKHTVKANESIAMLSAAYGFTEERFRQMNGLSPNEKIKEGQILMTLVCPVQAKVTENAAKITPENTKTDKGALPETKQAGIKQEEVTPYFDIQNGKITSLFSEPEIISSGDENQKTVKGSSSQREIYIVQQGDTVNGIAIKFNLTEAKLRQLNKLAEGEIVLPRQRIFLN